MSNTYPLRRRLIAGTIGCIGGLGLTACGDVHWFDSTPPPGPTSARPYSPLPTPTTNEELVRAQREFTRNSLELAGDIVANAGDGDSQIRSTNRLTLSNINAIRNNPSRVQTDFPEITLSYDASRRELSVRSTDWRDDPKDGEPQRVASEVEIKFQLAPGSNALSTRASSGEQVTLADFESTLASNPADVLYAETITSNPEHSAFVELNADDTYTYAQFAGRGNYPSVLEEAPPVIFSGLIARMRNIASAHEAALD